MEKAPRRTRRALILAVVALLLAGGAGGYLLVTGSDGEEVASSPVMVLDDDDGTSWWTTFGSTARPIEIGDGFYQATRLGTASDWAGVVGAGGPLLGTVTSDGSPQVVLVDQQSEDVTVLLDGGDSYSVYFDDATSTVFVVETRSSKARCHAGPLGGDLVSVTRGDGCSFSPDGRLAVSWEQQDEEDGVAFEVVTVAGDGRFSGESEVPPLFTRDGSGLVVVEARGDSQWVSILELSSGEPVAESSQSSSTSVLDLGPSGGVLVGSADDEVASIEYITPGKPATLVVEEQGSASGALLGGDGLSALVVTADGDRAVAQVARWGAGAPEAELEEIATADQLTGYATLDSSAYVVTEQDDSDEDAVMHVGTGSGVVEVDLNDFEGVDAVDLSVDGGTLVAQVFTDGGESVVSVDLGTGEVTWLLEAWNSVYVDRISADGSTILADGRENSDDSTAQVFVLRGSGDIEYIDEADTIGRVVFSPDGSSVVFTGYDGDARDVFRYVLGSKKRPEVLQADFALGSVGWDAAEGQRRLRTLSGVEMSTVGRACSVDFSYLPAFTVGESVSGTIEYEGVAEYCLEVTEEAFVSVYVEGDFDSFLSIDGPYGVDSYPYWVSDSNDDWNGSTNAGLSLTLPPGAYQIDISGYSGNYGSFTLFATFG